ncbi:MAG TPA: protein kinase [Gemmatimonadaceae bacterium]|jgi:serine/threonine protein kinase|nr:protein kinase [Gemmatimonadaceae bacterium]
MAEPTRTLDSELAALADDFEIIGEVSRGSHSKFLLAIQRAASGKRRDDQRRVLIEIARPPEGDEAHALEQLASDVNLLSTLRHRRLIPVLEGRWIGEEALAVVREYVDDPTVDDLLARGEPFTNTRTAAILREVHGLLQWAREQNVVHRCVATDRVFLEPMSDRVRVAFEAGALSRVRAIDPVTDDVRTVVHLAMSMLVGRRPAEETEGKTFAELRPDLPDRLHEETERLLAEPSSDSELTLYLALIGMADPVAEGETERDRIRAEILEEQRVEHEKLKAERADIRRIAEEERRRLAEEGEELRVAFAKEKERLEREFADAQRQIDEERAEMRRTLAAERAELAAKRDALERELAERVAQMERAVAADRANIDALRVSIRMAGEAELERKRAAALEELDDSDIRLDTGRYATPAFIAPKLAPFPAISFRRGDPFAKEGAIEEPVVPEEPHLVVKVVRKLRKPRRGPSRWPKWATRGGVAAAILLAAAAAVAVGTGSRGFADPLGVFARASDTLRGASARSAPATRPGANTPATPSPAPTYTTSTGTVGAQASADSVAADSASRAESLAVVARLDSVRRVRRDSIRRAQAALTATQGDSARARPAAAQSNRRARSERLDIIDLMQLRDSLAGAPEGGGSTTPP